MHSTARRRWTKCRTCAQVLFVVCRVLRLLCDSGMRHVGSLRVRALRRFIKATLAQSGHVVSKVRVATRAVSCAPVVVCSSVMSCLRCRSRWSWQAYYQATSLWLLFVTWYIHAFIHIAAPEKLILSTLIAAQVCAGHAFFAVVLHYSTL